MTLEARDIHVTLRDTKILKGVSLSIKPGKLVGLIGPNGAGKSTLLRAITGLVESRQGKILLDSRELSGWSLKERAKKISYGAQGAPVHWPLEVGHIIALGRIPYLDPWQQISARDREIIDQAMIKTDVAHLSGRLVTSLSGGERACVMLARAIVSKTDYLCLDEPTASLDPYHQLQVMDILQNLAREGRGVLILLHDLALAGRYCDELTLIHRGQILAQGNVNQVLSDKNITHAYHITANRKDGDPFLSPWRRSGRPEHDRKL